MKKIIQNLKKNKQIYSIGHAIHLFFIKLLVIPYSIKYLYADRTILHKQNKKSPQKYLILQSSDYTGLMTHVLAVMGWIKYAKEYDYILVVYLNSENNQYKCGDENTWEMYYEQPMVKTSVDCDYVKYIIENENYAIAHNQTRYNLTYSKYVPRWLIRVVKPTILFPRANDIVRDEDAQVYWERIYKDYIRPKAEIEKYAQAEFNCIFHPGCKTLGVLLRGTDYLSLRPYRHQIQPDIDSVISVIEGYRIKYNWDYIYLATEDERYETILKEKYPNKVLINKRTYDYGEEGRDMFQYGLAYFSSMYILSKCDMLIAGLCGGSQAAILMNQHQYSHLHVFDIGFYD